MTIGLLVCFLVGCGGDGNKDGEPADNGTLDVAAETVEDVALPGEVQAETTPADAAPEETLPEEVAAEVVDDGLPPGIFGLAGFDPALPLDDLAPLSVIVGDTAVVAMGESIHTSKGYYQAKHRVFQYLVEHEGFRVLAFESNWLPAQSIDAYVQTCDGDPVELVKEHLIYTWAGQSVADLIQWMCEYNQEHQDDPVHFMGVDVQQTWLDGAAIMAFLELAPPAEAEPLMAGIAECRCTTSPSHADCKEVYGELGKITDDEKQTCLDALAAVDTWLDANEADAIAATSEEQLAYARLNLLGIERNYVKNYHMYKGEYGLAYEARDLGMFEVFNKLREMHHPDAKFALWGHNWHIAHQTDAMTEPAVVISPVPVGIKASKGLGTFLHEALGDDYLAIGLHAYNLSVNWEGLAIGPMEVPTDESLEGMLHALGRPALLVDLAFPDAESPFFASGEKYVAGIFDNAGGLEVPIVPAEQYGAILFLDESPMMESLLW